jgi:diguanylate cyclase (GGDEF)-like protein
VEGVQQGVEVLVAALHRLALAGSDDVPGVAASAGEALVGDDPVTAGLRDALEAAAALALENALLRERLAGIDVVTEVNRQLEQELEEHWRFAAEVFHQSVTDELTGLYNRRGFVKRAEQELKALRDTGRPGLCLFLDLDGLKELNDTVGHEAGDQLLVEAAQLLRRLFREHDVLARIGGDEFAVFVPGYADVERVVQRLRQQTGRVRMSIGSAVFDPALPRNLYELLGEADADMYGDKRTKRTG